MALSNTLRTIPLISCFLKTLCFTSSFTLPFKDALTFPFLKQNSWTHIPSQLFLEICSTSIHSKLLCWLHSIAFSSFSFYLLSNLLLYEYCSHHSQHLLLIIFKLQSKIHLQTSSWLLGSTWHIYQHFMPFLLISVTSISNHSPTTSMNISSQYLKSKSSPFSDV